MGISIPVSVFVFALLAGCSSSVQVGLANAPVLGGATPEARVHDVVANGHDACERSAFPQGEVLRGQTPPCASKEGVARVLSFPRTAPPAAWVSPGYSLGVCPGAAPELTRAELGLVAVSLYSSRELVCRDLW
jgi:hypothetical protein